MNTPTAALPADALRVLLDNRETFLRFLEKRLRTRETAEEVLQEAFARGIDRGGALRDDESATAWFYRVLRNAVIDHYRRRGAEERALAAAALEWPTTFGADSDEEKLVCGCLGPLVDSLRPEYATALKQVDLGGASVKDFAAASGVTANNAGVRLHRAREALRRRVIDVCGACADDGCADCACEVPDSLRDAITARPREPG